ncbi:MAG: multicopper oxidase family protein [Chlamydiia bacterium]|nr:multicopper oxidase family protein [Chlamydiia bacterium]
MKWSLILMMPMVCLGGQIAPQWAVNESEKKGVVEVTLIAQETEVELGGYAVQAYTYNGCLPGPTIEAEVGDLLIVNFENHLPDMTTIHWHGLDVPALMDGTHLSQGCVPPGGSFRYEIPLIRAGVYWYHPHMHTNVQVEKGLSGMLVVRDPKEKKLGLPEHEHFLVLDDMLIDETGEIAPAFPEDPVKRVMEMFGRMGNVLLVNGQQGLQGHIQNGVPHRFHLVNVSNARFWRLHVPGHQLWKIGSDGTLFEKPILLPPIQCETDCDWTHGIMLTPGERADIIVQPLTKDKIEWVSYPLSLNSGTMELHPDGSWEWIELDDYEPAQTVLTLHLDGKETQMAYIPPRKLNPIPWIDRTGAEVIRVNYRHSMPDEKGNIVFSCLDRDGVPTPFPKLTPEDVPKLELGKTYIWEVHNAVHGAHNFHTHGFPFQPFEIEIVHPDHTEVIPYPYPELRDTIYVPACPEGEGCDVIVRSAMTIDDTGREGQAAAYGGRHEATHSGGWFFHCHVLEHSANGMMGYFQVGSGLTFGHSVSSN